MNKKKLAGIIGGCIIAIIVIVVIATPIPTYILSVSVNPPQAGSVSPASGEYKSGEQVTLTATPASGYTFDYWDGAASGSSNTVIITMNGDYNITANFVEDHVVIFPDTNLEAAVRQAISKPEGAIYASGLEGLTNLWAERRNVSNLSGLEYCTSLTYLRLNGNLDGNQVSNISPLADLTNLRELWLMDNQISDISPLANLTNLTRLYLVSNQISDISPLTNLTNLTVVWLMDNQISDISALANLTSLDYLHLNGNQISNISPLADLTNLREIELEDNQISDISPLANLTNLRVVWLPNNQISDISPLVQNDGLGTGDSVWLSENPLSSDSINIYIPQLKARGVTVYY